MTTLIDMTRLESPAVVEALDFETILAAMLADLQARDATFDALVESDPAYKILEVCAYRELLIRQRVNDAARSVMLAYAAGADLDHLAALYAVARLDGESDDSLRYRVQMAPEGWTCAGSSGAYRYHAMSAAAGVADVGVRSEAGGQVTVTVLAADGDGTPGAGLLDAVAAALDAETVRPLCDTVTVEAAEIVPYAITAALWLHHGPDAETVRAAATAAAEAYAHEQHRLGRDVTLSGLYAALHRPGVQRVVLSAPTADLIIDGHQAPHCTAVTVTVAGRDE